MNQTDSSHMQTKAVEITSESRRARNTIRVALIVVLAGLIGSPVYVFLGTQYGAWQLYVMAGLLVFTAAMSGLVIFLVRRGRPTLGAWILLGILVIILFAPSVFIAGSGLLIGLLVVVPGLLLGTQLLPPRYSNWILLFGILVGVGAGLLDVLAPPIQMTLPALSNFWPVIVGLLLLSFVVILVFQFRALNLSNKIVVAFLMVTFSVAGVVAFFTQRSTGQTLRENVGINLYNVATTQGLAIGNQIGKQIDLLYSLSISKNVVDEVDFANLSYTGDEAAIQAEIEELDTEWLVAAEEEPRLSALIEGKLNNELARQLNEFKESYPDHVEVFLTDRYGALIASTDVTSDYYQADEEWWQRAYNDGWGGFYVSPPVFDESAGLLSVQIAVPVRAYEDPKALGVLRTTYQFGALAETLGEVELGQTGAADLVFLNEDNELMHLHEGDLEPISPEFSAQLNLAARELFSEMDLEGQPNLVARALVVPAADTSLPYKHAISALGWQVIVHQESEEALAPVQEQVRAILLLTVVIVGLVSVVAIWLSGILAGPITRLTSVAEQVREGDLAARAHVESSDEVGRLATTFNEMTDRLRQTLGGLEQRVTERTRELTLSGEVGRSLSRERELDRLLKNAVELIQSSFDLYYTQIYLPDPSGENLVLRSGTGDVGAELLARGHRLPLSPGSINGLAATEKRPVIVADTATSVIFRPNPLLPDTRSEMAVPLLVGERVSGVLDMQSAQAGALSEEVLPAFEALAGQLAIAVENATLFTQAQQARAEVESQARRLTREGWREFLDAVERSERIGYIYDRTELIPLDTPLSPGGVENTLATPILVTGEPVGAIQLERDPDQIWTQTESELAASVADQVSRQIENLRLLAQAESFRVEAEAAASRLTREGWEDYLTEGVEGEIGFVYDQTRVQPLQAGEYKGDGGRFTHPLVVRGEMIGELALEGDEPLDEEDLDLFNAVAERLGDHIEGLRLTAQTQVALAQTDALYGISHSLNEASNEDEILKAISQPAIESGVFSTNLIYLDLDESGEPEWAELVAAWPPEGEHAVPVGTRYYLPQMPFTRLWVANPDEPLLVSDVTKDERVDERTRAAMAQGGSRAMAVIPLTRGRQRVGLIIFNWDGQHEFRPQEAETYRALIGLGSPAVQTRRLFERTQARARHERILRQVTERVRGAMDPDVVLRTAVRELGTVFGRNVLIRLGGQLGSEEGPGNGDGKQ